MINKVSIEDGVSLRIIGTHSVNRVLNETYSSGGCEIKKGHNFTWAIAVEIVLS